jgi:hypothetical protein
MQEVVDIFVQLGGLLDVKISVAGEVGKQADANSEEVMLRRHGSFWVHGKG